MVINMFSMNKSYTKVLSTGCHFIKKNYNLISVGLRVKAQITARVKARVVNYGIESHRNLLPLKL
jgi:hypothetical protein